MNFKKHFQTLIIVLLIAIIVFLVNERIGGVNWTIVNAYANVAKAEVVQEIFSLSTVEDEPVVTEPEAIEIEVVVPGIEDPIEEQEDVFITSSPDITFSYKYVNSDIMPYALATPSTAETNEKTPLIISLHGKGDIGTSGNNFSNKFIAKLMQNWELEGFNAYVMMPHLSGSGYAESWNNKSTAKKLFALIDEVIETYNIDTDRIIIQGQSMGGYGCLYMAAYDPTYFAAVVPVSPYNSNAKLANLAYMPIRCYVGKSGEDRSSIQFVKGTFADAFGEDVIFQRDVSHNEIPIVAFTEDLDGDNKSDLVEWMLAQNKYQG